MNYSIGIYSEINQKNEKTLNRKDPQQIYNYLNQTMYKKFENEKINSSLLIIPRSFSVAEVHGYNSLTWKFHELLEVLL